MAFVQAKCENCGGFLTVDPKLKAANCPFCGAAYVVQDAINYYHSTTNIEHLHANVVNVQNDNSVEAKLEAAEAFLKIRNTSAALNAYQDVAEMKPQDYRCWLGMLNCNMMDWAFEGPMNVKNKPEIDSAEYKSILNSIKADANRFNEIVPVYLTNYSNFKTFAPPDVVREFEPKWASYMNKLKERAASYRTVMNEAEKAFEAHTKALNGKATGYDAKIAELKGQIASLEKQNTSFKESKLVNALDSFTNGDIDSGFLRTIWMFCLFTIGAAIIVCIAEYALAKKFDLATAFLGSAIFVLILGIMTDISVARSRKARVRHNEASSALGAQINGLRRQINETERAKSDMLYRVKPSDGLEYLKKEVQNAVNWAEGNARNT